MDTRVITDELIFPIVKILTDDSELMLSRQRLCLALGLSLGDSVDIERMSMPSYDTHVYLTAALNKWLTKLDTQPTVRTLAGILRSENFIATSDKIIEFGKHVAHLDNLVKNDVGLKNAKPQLCYNVPEDNSSKFIGRDEDIERLHGSIVEQNFPTGNGNTPKQITVLTTLSGNGGMGKSCIASHYALKYFKSDFYYNVIWINSESIYSISTSFRELAERVGISIYLESSQISQEIYKYCEDSMTLIVFHKVQLGQSIAQFLPVGTSSTGLKPFILYTSSYDDSSRETHSGVDLIYLDAFKINDSIDFLNSLLNVALETEEERNLAEIICTKLGNLPLALKLAGVFIRNEFEDQIESENSKMVIQLKNYLKLLDQDCRQMTSNVSDIFETYTFMAWKTTIDKLKVLNPMTESIMQISAYLSPGKIPIQLLHQIKPPSHGSYFNKVQGKIKGFIPEVGRSSFESTQASVHLLLSYALINRESETSVRIHPLLQKVIRSEVEAKSKYSTLKDTIDLLKAEYKTTSYSEYEQTCLKHSARLANYMFSNDIKVGGYPSKLYDSIISKQNLSLKPLIDRLVKILTTAGKYKDLFESYNKYREMFDVELIGMSLKEYNAEIFAMRTVMMFCGNMQLLWQNGSACHQRLVTMCKICVLVLKEVKMFRIRWQIGMLDFKDTADALLASANVTEDPVIKQFFFKILVLMYNILFDYSKFFGIHDDTQKYWKYVSACQYEIQLMETVD